MTNVSDHLKGARAFLSCTTLSTQGVMNHIAQADVFAGRLQRGMTSMKRLLQVKEQEIATVRRQSSSGTPCKNVSSFIFRNP